MKFDIYVYMLRCNDGSYYVGTYRGAVIEWKEALVRGDEAALKAFSRRGFRPEVILRDGAAPFAAPPQDEAESVVSGGVGSAVCATTATRARREEA